MKVVSPYLLIITLHLNTKLCPQNKPRAAKWIKNKIKLYAAQKRLSSALTVPPTESRGMKRDILSEWKPKKVG